MDAEELRQRYQAGERDFAGIHFYNVDLSRIYLARANLQGSKFIQTNLNDADFTWADLSNADFSGSNLCYADFDEAILRNAIFLDADLNRAELIGADLTGVDLTQALNVSTTYLLQIDEENNPHTELVNTIRNLTRGLRNSYGSDSSKPYDVFLWDVASRGDFTLEKFLKAIGLLVEIQLIDLLDSQFPIEEFSTLLNYIRPYLAEYKFYFLKAGRYWLDLDNGVPLLIGNTKTGDFIGVSPDIGIDKGGWDTADRIEDRASAKSENQDLVAALTKASAEIKLEYWGDYVDSFVWELAENKETLLENLFIANETMLVKNETVLLREFHRGFFGENDEEFYLQENPEEMQKVRTLSDLIRANLKNLRVYWFNDGEIAFYLIGQTDDGDWLGIYNRLII